MNHVQQRQVKKSGKTRLPAKPSTEKEDQCEASRCGPAIEMQKKNSEPTGCLAARSVLSRERTRGKGSLVDLNNRLTHWPVVGPNKEPIHEPVSASWIIHAGPPSPSSVHLRPTVRQTKRPLVARGGFCLLLFCFSLNIIRALQSIRCRSSQFNPPALLQRNNENNSFDFSVAPKWFPTLIGVPSGHGVATFSPLFFFANNNVFLSFLVSVPRKRPTIDYQFRQTSKDSIRN